EGRMIEVDRGIGPALHPESRRALVSAAAQQRGDREHVPLPRPAPGDPLQLSELLERVDPDVRVRADADPDPALADLIRRAEAVAEIRLRGRADANPRAGLGQEVELSRVRMGCVDNGRVRAETARLREQLDRAQAMLGEAL